MCRIASNPLPGHRLLPMFLAVASLFFCVGMAQARTETIRWSQPNMANVTGWKIYVGSASRAYDTIIDARMPTPDGSDVYQFDINVSGDSTVYIAMTSYNSEGLESTLSNERVKAVGAGTPPPPEPEPLPGDQGSTGSNTLSGGSEIPANPSAIVRFDFNSGSASNWVDTAANNSMVQDDSLFSVVSVGGNPALTTQSNGTDIHSHFVGSPSGMANLVFTGRMAIESTGGGVGVTAYSAFPVSDVYYRLRTRGGNYAFELAGHPHATASCNGTTDTGIVARAGEWYEFEMTIENLGTSNRISASVWRQGDPKPSSAQVECTDSASNRPLAGTVGVWSMGTERRYWDDLEVTLISGSAQPVPNPPAPPLLISVEPVPGQ